MKLFKLLFFVMIIAFIGGFAFFAMTDVDVEQKTVTKTIGNDRFFVE